MAITELKHPLIEHKLTYLRDKNTDTKTFRENLNEIAKLMIYEVTKDLELEEIEIETPIQNELGDEVMPVVKKYGPIAKQLHRKLMSRKSDILSSPEADMLDDTWFDGNYRDAAEYNRIMPKIFDKQIRALKSIL